MRRLQLRALLVLLVAATAYGIPAEEASAVQPAVCGPYCVYETTCSIERIEHHCDNLCGSPNGACSDPGVCGGIPGTIAFSCVGGPE
jgi:hypothetical protein